MSARNYYDELEVSPAASAEVIRAAYKSLMQRHHPDKNPGDAGIAQRAAAIAQAYDVLSDPQKRETYDRTVLPASSIEPALGAGASMARVAQRPVRRQDTAGWNVWYVWLLVVCIVASGWGIHVLSKDRAAPKPVAQEHPSHASVASIEPRIRTVPAFVTNLSVDLTSTAAGAGDRAHVLFIPEIVLRLEIDEAERWARKIEQDRTGLTQQLIARLSHASYDDLAGTEGDLVLRRLIEDTLSAALGLNAYGQLPPGVDPTLMRGPPLKALLPQLYSVK